MIPNDPVAWAVTAFADGRNPSYDRYDRYMCGDQPLEFASEKFRQTFGRRFRAFAYNRCVVPETPIWTKRGVIAAGAIREGDQVIGHDGSWRAVTNVRSITTDEPLLTLRSRSSPPITVTMDHPLLVTKKDDLQFITSKYANEDHIRIAGVKARASFRKDSLPREWVPAEQIAPGDLVWGAVPVGTGPVPSGITDDHIRLLGWYLAEGSVSRIGRLAFSFHEKETEFIEEIQELLLRCFDAKSVVQPDRVGSHGVGVVTYNKDAAEWFIRFGGAGCENKQIDPELFNSSADLGPLVAAAWLGDGRRMTDGPCQSAYTTVSFALAAQLHAILLRYGIVTTWNSYQVPGKRAAFTLCVGGDHARQLAVMMGEPTGTSSYDKAPNGVVIDGMLATSVKSIAEANPAGEVIALTVEGTSSYTHPGSITSHNCRSVVDAYADRLQVSGFGAPTAPELAKAAKAIWSDNLMSVREGHVYADQLGLGDAYIIAEVHPDTGKVQYWPNDPRLIRLHWDADQPNTIDLAAKQWVEGKQTRLNLYFRDRIEKYVADGREGTARFEQYQPEGEEWPVFLPVDDTVPVFHFANNGRTNSYGESELRSVLPLQDGVNKTLMDMFVAMELVSFPQRVIMGMETAETDEQKAMVKAFEAGMMRILTLEDPTAKIGEFNAADIRQYIDVGESLDQDISRVTKVPVHYLGMSGDFPSGEALRMAELPFVAKVQDRQRNNGSIWSDVQRYGLRLLGYDVKPGVLVTNWESAASVSEDDRINRVQRMVDAGYPFVSALRETGYDPEQIKTIQEEKAAEDMLADFGPQRDDAEAAAVIGA